jgi:predicted secreted protein
MTSIRSRPGARFIAIAASLGISCNCAAPAHENAIAVLTEADSGKIVTLTLGQTLRVELPASFGTGYSWQVTEMPPLLKQAGSAAGGAAQYPGQTERQILTFTAATRGKGTLVLEYRRAWEKTATPAKAFSATVEISR